MQIVLAHLLAAMASTPAAADAPVIRFDPPQPRLGDLLLIYVKDEGDKARRGRAEVLGYAVSLMRVAPGILRGSAAMPIDIEPGHYSVRVRLGGKHFDYPLEVRTRDFESSELRVSRRFTKRKSKRLRARLRRETAAMSRIWQADPTPPRMMGRFVRPVEGEITGLFGTRRIFNGKRKSTHLGFDLDGEVGDPVRAIGAGKVVMSAMRWTSGGTIVIDHGHGLFSSYFHLSRRDRKVGDVVKTGGPIGAVGRTGRVTGPHLHLAVVARSVYLTGKKKGTARSMYVDPQQVLELNLWGAAASPGDEGQVVSVGAHPFAQQKAPRSPAAAPAQP